MNLKSKIFWVNILGIAVTIIGAISKTLSPEQAIYAASFVQILTIFLRQLQGKTISLGGVKIKL